MDRTEASGWQHSHDYTVDTSVAERRTRIVIAITATMMVVEIGAGIVFGSMALLADGWHMSTHVAAFLITALAYHYSRRHRADARYSFGTGKVGVLGGFASAIVLAVIALLMAGESVHRFFAPQAIQFNQAIGVAIVGLLVNLVCAWLLHGEHHHARGHGHDHGHRHHHRHHDLNLRAAYVHVLADAITSLTAIAALTAGKFLGWSWLDPMMGIVGSAVVSAWAYGLIRDSSGILLDRTPESSDLPDEIRRAVGSDGDSVIGDLHVWQVASGKFAAIVCIAGPNPKPPEAYRAMLREHEELVHVTVEVRRGA
ncbi:MAG TPA: CDF family Co(II)/Ni(II) efflux transporter DmeF [Verrucomicrobiota bacterium]|nr:CDF family Co(II)/Ni(II) efflux transporter DmeF [Verrucomicrobiota bacterium]HRZ36730.1 CDF family Co(II)/Ni(II) efflux transporter DmeF [Candidatus Paceibacterota bacterium]HRZ55047.1 CDF family Co(II)/Ni(II) efflux transporter DmeF [Candidatus Paceibacterota bacterium]